MSAARYRPPRKRTKTAREDGLRYAALDFFAGSGLVSFALRDHFDVVWANDICPRKARVYAANHGDTHFDLRPIQDVHGHQLPYGQLSWASFPCQDLSLAGKQGGIFSERSGLVWEWLRVLDEMPRKPRVLVAENVVGLVSSQRGAHFIRLHEALSARGYRSGAVILDAVHWLPHSRPRVFLVAVERTADLPDDLWLHGPGWCHSEAIREAAKGLREWVWWKIPRPAPRRLGLSDLIEWKQPSDGETQRSRIMSLVSPAHLRELSRREGIRPAAYPGYRRTRDGRQVLEIRFDNVAGCLRTPEGGSSRQYLIMRDASGEVRSRLLTVREVARLMGAPDSYLLPGSYNDAYKAMGDAVAVPVARWLAKHLLTRLCAVTATSEMYHA